MAQQDFSCIEPLHEQLRTRLFIVPVYAVGTVGVLPDDFS